MTYGKRQFENLDGVMRRLIPEREAAMQEGLKQAVGVPLALAEKISVLWSSLQQMVLYGNIGCKSDAQVAAKALETAVYGAYYNVLINLKDISDEAFKVAVSQPVTFKLFI
ncbi:hypothetical protein XENOCAPTIV_030125 [Xenoophorus captivus]|uniref:Cyclodeaminase/cyclohydrolase domain-containing protein n=1 Tax=Xenoophorus captivus TaxID=1517983 RepID=A0ABV0Q6X7_9TELE